MLGIALCLSILLGSSYDHLCTDKKAFPSITISESLTKAGCPLKNAECAAWYNPFLNSIAIDPAFAQDPVLLKGTLAHELCHWADTSTGIGCNCDPFEVERLIYLQHKRFDLYLTVVLSSHDSERVCLHSSTDRATAF